MNEFDELEAAINEYGREVDAEQRAELERTAKQIVTLAKGKCPKDSGALSESLDYELVGDEATIGVREDYFKTIEGGEVRHPADYAEKVELGDGDQAAEPFFRPAIDEVIGHG